MKTLTILSLIMVSGLSACGVPDLVAHGVKAYEKSQDELDKNAQSIPDSPPPAQVQTQPAPDPLPPDAFVPPPSHDAITKEPLK